MTQAIEDVIAENARLRYHLIELGKVADAAGLVLATIEAENSDEEAGIQAIIDGIATWGPDAILGKPKEPPTTEHGEESYNSVYCECNDQPDEKELLSCHCKACGRQII